MSNKTLREAAIIKKHDIAPHGYFDEHDTGFRAGVRAALADSADAPEGPCNQCGGETYVVDLTRCRGCSNEFYTANQSRAASRNRLDAQQEKES